MERIWNSARVLTDEELKEKEIKEREIKDKLMVSIW